jgi:hypothetical protein
MGSYSKAKHESEAIRHVVYEYAMLITAGELLKGYLDPPINSHIQDAFLLSCRKVADFLLRQGGPRDITVTCFGMDFLDRKDFPTWNKWADVLNFQLAQLRFSPPIPEAYSSWRAISLTSGP